MRGHFFVSMLIQYVLSVTRPPTTRQPVSSGTEAMHVTAYSFPSLVTRYTVVLPLGDSWPQALRTHYFIPVQFT